MILNATDDVMERLIDLFIANPSIELPRNAYDEIEVECRDGTEILILKYFGKPVEITVREVV